MLIIATIALVYLTPNSTTVALGSDADSNLTEGRALAFPPSTLRILKPAESRAPLARPQASASRLPSLRSLGPAPHLSRQR